MFISQLKVKLETWEKRQLTRKRNVVTLQENNSNFIKLNGNVCINFSSNDYLGLTKHPKIRKAFANAAERYGFGSGASALISGYSEAHSELEKKFEQLLKVDKAILFNSGYHANIGVINALVTRSDTVFSDKLIHASMLEGIRLSLAKHYRYKHCDVEHLESLCKTKKPDLIITESVFSMEGDIFPIKDILTISDQYSAGLIIDDAHGIGILGKQGGGICEQEELSQNQFTCLIAPLGKAFNGIGAIVAGRNEVIETILQFSKSYRYTTALPAAVCVALQTALEIIIKESWRREQLNNQIRFFIDQAKEKNLALSSTEHTPIKSIIVGDTDKVLLLQKFLLEKGFYVAAIRPPTVANNTARLRISLNCFHTEDEIIRLLNLIANFYQYKI